MRNENLTVRIQISLGRREMLGLLTLLLICLKPLQLGSESITMSTTYPSPVGIYSRIITTGGSAGAPTDTILNRDAGNTGIGTSNPQAKLDIVGDGSFVLFPRKSTAGDPAGALDGSIYYNSILRNFRALGAGNGWANIGSRFLSVYPRIASNNAAAVGGWATVNANPFTQGGRAQALVVKVSCGEARVFMRTTGSGMASNDMTEVCLAGNNATNHDTVVIPLDPLGRFDWHLERTAPPTYAVSIYLIGWF